MAGETNTSYNADFAAAVNAGAQLLGSTMNGLLASINSDADRKYNTRVRAENRQWALEDYERILKDSSPLANMNRLREAGLNPNLVYGTGNIQSGTTMMPREASLPDSHRRPFQIDLATMNAMGNYLDLKLKEAEIKKTEAESNKVESETTGLDLQNKFNEDTLSLREAMLANENHKILRETSQIDNDIWQSTLKTNSDINLSNEQQATLIQGRFYQVLDYDLRLWEIGENIKAQIKHLANEATNAKANLQNAAANFLKAATERDLAAPEIASRWIDYNVKTLEEKLKGEDYYIKKQSNLEIMEELDRKLKYKKYLNEGNSGIFDEFLDAFGTFLSPTKIKL